MAIVIAKMALTITPPALLADGSLGMEIPNRYQQKNDGHEPIVSPPGDFCEFGNLRGHGSTLTLTSDQGLSRS
jgi:hypothetical protein